MAAMDFHTYDNTLYEKVYQTAYQAAAELIETAGMKAGQILVVGCSTSEVGGEKIGTYSSPELAAKVFGGIYAAVQEKGIYQNTYHIRFVPLVCTPICYFIYCFTHCII